MKFLIDKNNYPILNRICSKDKPAFHESYYVHANMYWTCLQVIELAQVNSRYLLENILSMDGVSATLDVEHLDHMTLQEFMGGGIDKTDDNMAVQNRYKDFFKNRKKNRLAKEFTAYLDATKEEGKVFTLRLYIKVETKEQLQDKLEKVLLRLKEKEIRASIQINDLRSEYKSLTTFADTQKYIASSALIMNMLMIRNVSVIKPYVSVLGYTHNGVYAEDYASYQYQSFSVCFIGKQGSGKSAMMKTVLEDALLRNDHIIVLDIHNNEYQGLCDRYGVPAVSFNESMYLNPVEIFSGEQEEISGYDVMTAVSKLFDILNPKRSLSVTQADRLSIILSEMYEPYLGKKLTDLKREDWFLISDIKRYIEKQKANGAYAEEMKHDIYVIETWLEKYIKSYGSMFDHHTNVSIEMDRSLRFDVSFLNNIKDEIVTSSYLTMLFSYISKSVMENERYNNEKEQSLPREKLLRATRALYVSFDETSKYLAYPAFLKAVNQLMKLTRKARTVFLFAIHSKDDVDVEDQEVMTEIASLFKLCANYIIGQIDGETGDFLSHFIPALSKQDMRTAAGFRKGMKGERTFIAVNDRGEKVQFRSLISEKQQKYYGGGI